MDPMDALRREFNASMPDVIRGLRDTASRHAPEALQQREAGYQILNTADEATVRVYDEIWEFGVNASDLIAELDQITAPKMRVEINSPGGNLFDGIAIFNALRNHPAHITTRVDALAASAASIIAQAGDHRVMLDASQMMIHNAWALSVGDTNDHADMAQLLQQQDEVIAGIYASRSGKDVDHFRTLMGKETWLTAARAVEEGLADEVVEPVRKQEPENRVTLHDKISNAVSAVEEAITSTETVSAVRAEAGKTLSNRIVDDLSGLREQFDRLEGLLPQNSDDDGTENESFEVDVLRTRHQARSHAPVAVH